MKYMVREREESILTVYITENVEYDYLVSMQWEKKLTERERPINETFQKRYDKKCMESAQSTSSKPLGGWRTGIDDGPARVLLRDADIFDAEPGACTPCVELDAWSRFAAVLPLTLASFRLRFSSCACSLQTSVFTKEWIVSSPS
jgi:hypothetical protein